MKRFSDGRVYSRFPTPGVPTKQNTPFPWSGVSLRWLGRGKTPYWGKEAKARSGREASKTPYSKSGGGGHRGVFLSSKFPRKIMPAWAAAQILACQPPTWLPPLGVFSPLHLAARLARPTLSPGPART